MKLKGEDDHLQAMEKSLEQIPPSQPLKGTDPAHTFISDFQPPPVREYICVISATQSVVLCYSAPIIKFTYFRV